MTMEEPNLWATGQVLLRTKTIMYIQRVTNASQLSGESYWHVNTCKNADSFSIRITIPYGRSLF